MAIQASSLISKLSALKAREEEKYIGLVSRSGVFFRCADYGHESLAKELDGDLFDLIYKYGWVHIGIAGGIFTGYDTRLTKQQLDCLRAIEKLTASESIERGIAKFLHKRGAA